MILQTKLNGNAVVAAIQVKEANLTVSEQFKTELIALIDANAKYLVVDFGDVVYVDSSFLGALVSALKHALSNKTEVVVAALNKDILGLFQLIRLDKAFKIYTSADEALAAKPQ